MLMIKTSMLGSGSRQRNRLLRKDPICMGFMKLTEDYYKGAITAGEWLQPDNDQRTTLVLEV
jgi:hypothetical protein